MITVEQLKIFLQSAKDKHTKLHGNDPTHDWVSFYANEIYDEIINEMHKETAGIIGLRAYKKVSDSYPVIKAGIVPSDVITGNLPDNPTEQGC